MNYQDLVITSIETVNVYHLNGDYWFTLDELQSASIANAEESTDITGRSGRRLGTMKRNKNLTISGNSGLVSGGLLEAQTGGTFEKKAATVMWTDYLTVGTGNEVATDFAPVGGKIDQVLVKNASGVADTELTLKTGEGAVAEGEYVYTSEGHKLTFHTSVAVGTEIVVRYHRTATNASVLEVDSDHFSQKGRVYVDALGEDKCGNVFRVQISAKKVDISGNFTLDFGDNQTVHAFEAQTVAGACDGNGYLWTYTVFTDAND